MFSILPSRLLARLFLHFFCSKSILLFLGPAKRFFHLQDASWGWTPSSSATTPSPPQGEAQKSNGADGQRQKPPPPPQHHCLPLPLLLHSCPQHNLNLNITDSFSSLFLLRPNITISIGFPQLKNLLILHLLSLFDQEDQTSLSNCIHHRFFHFYHDFASSLCASQDSLAYKASPSIFVTKK